MWIYINVNINTVYVNILKRLYMVIRFELFVLKTENCAK